MLKSERLNIHPNILRPLTLYPILL